MAPFEQQFEHVAGNRPFPWQRRLFNRLCDGDIPAAVDLPTGLGKTSVMAIWRLARAAGAKLPRRLVYVVDRRAVVDQATSIAERLKEYAGEALRVSTLRGQHVDNKEWLNDPAADAIVVGTVDMIGSRLLFEGYGVSRKMRPYHAGLLGADALVVLDEAHLVPPFEKLLEAIEGGGETQGAKAAADRAIVPPFRLMSLSATGRERKGDVFRLDEDDARDSVVKKRLDAKKAIEIVGLTEGKVEDALAAEAWKLAQGGTHSIRCLIYCDSRDTAEKVHDAIEKFAAGDKKKDLPKVEVERELFVGARRVKEREDAARRLTQLGFIGGGDGVDRPAFVVATSAGEVGVDMDADHLVCDFVSWERMIQRFGRVNRRGSGDARIVVIDEGQPAPKKPDKPTPQEQRKALFYRSLAVIKELPSNNGRYDASPNALRELKARTESHPRLATEIEAATTPAPLRPALTRALVDAWSMTSLEEHTGRPEVEPWLRGWIDDDRPQTSVIWREHPPMRDGAPASKREVEAFFEAAPPHVSGVLETETNRVAKWLIARAGVAIKRDESASGVVFVLGRANDLRRTLPLREIVVWEQKELERQIANCTLVIAASLGGLKEGMLDEKADDPVPTADGEGEWMRVNDAPVVRFRVRKTRSADVENEANWRERHRFASKKSAEGEALEWLVVDKWRGDAANEDDRALSPRAQSLSEHQSWTEEKALRLAKQLDLPAEYREALAVAAFLHDEGKKNLVWQRAFNAKRDDVYAKTTGPVNVRLLAGYRHEFGSLPYAEEHERFRKLPEPKKDLVLHLIAAHHGRARPVIDTAGCDDAPPSALDERAAAVALRFARLQKQWGPWGLAWWEALLRAADQQASRENDERGEG